jgi:uncharacterized membrane protein
VTAGSGGRAWIALGIALSAAFAIAAHAALIEGTPPAVGAAVSVVPVMLLTWVLARRSRSSALLVAALVAAALATWLSWAALEQHFPDLLFVEHAATNLLLAVVFGRTLSQGRESLVTTFARLVHGALPPEVERYTRRVTLAWTLFFAAMFTVSCALYLSGQRALWSMFANFATPIGVGAMFALEYAIRHRVLPHWERVGIMGGVRAFSRHFSQARP